MPDETRDEGLDPDLEDILGAVEDPPANPATDEDAALALVDDLTEIADAEDAAKAASKEKPADGQPARPQIDLSKIPKELQAAARTFFPTGARSQDLLDILQRNRSPQPAERPDARRAEAPEEKPGPESYEVELPENAPDWLKPFTESIVSGLGKRMAGVERENIDLRRQIRERDSVSEDEKFETMLESYHQKLGDDAFPRVVGRAGEILQRRPGLLRSLDGIGQAMDTALAEYRAVAATLRAQRQAKSGAIPRSRAIGAAGSGSLIANDQADNSRDAVLIAARRIRQMGGALPEGF